MLHYKSNCYIIGKFGATLPVDVTLEGVVTLSGVTGWSLPWVEVCGKKNESAVLDRPHGTPHDVMNAGAKTLLDFFLQELDAFSPHYTINIVC